jgi:nicotinamidase-related amidase/YHS domain-containing protein
MNTCTMTMITTITACAAGTLGCASQQAVDDSHEMKGQDAKHVYYIDGPREDAPIPRPGVQLARGDFALVVIDPQNDFLSPNGVAWGVVGESATENGTVENIGHLFKVAKDADAQVFVSPHYYYPHDHDWEFEGALETLMHDIGMFDRKGPLNTEGLEGSGADWLAPYKPYIEDGETVIVAPHKVYGPETNDLALQLRKRGISQIVLAGMSANLCVESHMRDLIEDGFEVVVVSDATAAAKLPGYDGFEAAFVNYRMIASDVWSTDEAVEQIAAARGDLVNVSGASNIGLAGFDPVSFFSGSTPKNGSPMIRAQHAGATYLFADEMSKSEFESDPDRYAPQYGGFCAYGVSLGILLPVDITTAQVRNDKLYLNVNSAILEKFNADFDGSIDRANANWAGLFDEHAE